MQKNLVIVESPAKAKTIEKFLGKDYKVLSSYGHIRDLSKKNYGIDLKTFQPEYEVPADKEKLVRDLKAEAAKAENIWLASDEDREGEAISWHLAEVLGLDPKNSRRIVFHEITKPAILAAIEHPRHIDLNLVDAQQARRVLDRIVGFKLSPVLWRKVRPSLSAGRVQSVAVRLIVEREREITAFKSEAAYRVVAYFDVPDGNGVAASVKAELNTRFKTREEARAFLERCADAAFTVSEVVTRPTRRTPAPPFTTSTLQQEAARKLGFPVAVTMRIAQKLYEEGLITYMRTDSMNLSGLCLSECRQVITEQMGADYHQPRQYHTHTKGAQEAHEAIRPTDMERQRIKGTAQENRLYDLIWKRTVACQMADARLEKTTVNISLSNSEEQFVASGEVIKFDGFLKVYREGTDNDNAEDAESEGHLLPPMTQGQTLCYNTVTAQERFTQHPPRYTEASLVHKLEELGIGRPSTYAPTISTIQQREYVVKGDKAGEERSYHVITLDHGALTETEKTEMAGAEKNKLLPTDVGIVVNDFLMEYFPEIMDYNFTARVEKDFDRVAEGKESWTKLMHRFYDKFEPQVERTLAEKSEHKVGERQLGVDAKTGEPVYVKIGRYGPVVQLGEGGADKKPRFAQLRKGQSMETLTLDEALDLFKLPRDLGEFEGKKLTVAVGRFGPYVQHNGKFASIPKDIDPLDITREEAEKLILERREAEAQRHIKAFEEDAEMEVLNGRYGPYVCWKGQNYRLPKDMAARAAELTYDECRQLVEKEAAKPKTTRGRRSAAKK